MLKQISFNSLWLLLSRVLTYGLNIVFIAIVARNLGVGTFGQFTILATIVHLGNIFTTFGIDVLLIRETAREKRVTPLVSTALWLQIYLSILWCSIFLAGSSVFLSLELVVSLFIYNLSLLPLAVYTVFSSLLRAFERMDLFMALNLFAALLQLVGAITLVKTSDDLLVLCIWMVSAQILTASAGAFLCRKLFPLAWLGKRPIFAEVVNLIRSGWRIALFAPLSLLARRLDLLMLSWLSGEVATGLFSASTRLVEGLKMGHFAVTNSLMPSMSRTASPQQESLYKISLFGMLWFSIILAVTVTPLAELIIGIIYGPDFVASIEILKIIVWVLVPYTFSVYYSLILIMRGAESIALKVNLIGVLSGGVLYLLLIPMFGLRGAAWGTLVSETLQAAILLMASHRLSKSNTYATRLT